jgi:outer membrane biosynthesis protein TonB
MKNEEKREIANSTKGYTSSLLLHSLLILIGITPLATFQAPIWEEQTPGMEVALGFPDEGQGNDEPSPALQNSPGGPPPAVSHTSAATSSSTPPSAADPSPTKGQDVITSDASEEIAIAKAREEKRRADQAQVEAERRRNAEIEAERARQAAAAQKAAEYASAKSKYGGLLGGKGTGRGNTGTAGNQGDPNGDPNAKNLEGINTGGKGRIGGGLGNRGVVSEPKISESTQKTGRVVIKVCVNRNGNVISAEYTQKGSTTNNSTLIGIATRNAMKFKFTDGDLDQQCGTITYDFKVQ